MAYTAIGLGSTANDGTGDTLRTAGTSVNANFVELYTLLGTGSALTSGISADASICTLTAPKIKDSSADHFYVFAVSELSSDRTVTLPLLAGSDEFTFNAHTQTLTNKTLTSPTINTPSITAPTVTGILDLTGSVIAGTNALVFEGSGTDAYETTFAITNPTTIDKVITFPNLTGNVTLDTNIGATIRTTNSAVNQLSMFVQDMAQESGAAAVIIDGINTESTLGDKMMQEDGSAYNSGTYGDNLKFETSVIKILTSGGATAAILYGASA